MRKGEWSDRAVVGAEFHCRVTTRARRESIMDEGGIKVSVCVPPEDGRANAAVAAVLAQALGVAKTRLTLLRGATSRDKVFRLE